MIERLIYRRSAPTLAVYQLYRGVNKSVSSHRTRVAQ